MIKNKFKKINYLLTITILLTTVIYGKQKELKMKLIEQPLAKNGAINLWTFVDKLAFPNGEEDIQQTLKDDLLPNEAALNPLGGDTFSFAKISHKWGVIKLIDGYYELSNDAAKGGKALDYSGAYVFTNLDSSIKQNVTLLLRSDDSPKVYLNGKLIFSKYCQRGVYHKKEQGGEDEVTLPLKKGVNKLLIRVDNYRFGAGIYCRLVDKNQEPIKNITTFVKADKKLKVWNYRSSYENPFVYLNTLPVLAEPFEIFYGSRIQRTMTLLETSTQTTRNKVKILFYGQSIVSGMWHRIVLNQLRERYPYAIIEAENRAIGGHEGPVLVRCASQDLYPFYPDLVIFHVYGGMKTGEQERIFRNIRKFTTAEILTFSHHFSNFPNSHDDAEHDESKYYKYLAQKYNCEFSDVRKEWGRYLKHYNFERSELLGDGIHPNSMGSVVLANIVLKHFKFSTLFTSGWYNQVKNYEARRFFEEKEDEITFTGKSWKSKGHGWGVVGSKAGDSLKLTFVGNRVDIVVPERSNTKVFGSAKVLIDGKAPSQIQSLYVATRSSLDIKKSRPAIKRITVGDNAIKEEWIFRITEVSDDCKKFSYEVIGSVTGNDGTGTNKSKFVSKSGRITLEPKDLHPFSTLHKKRDDMIGFEIKWDIITISMDTFAPIFSDDTAIENSYILAQGLPNKKHVLELILNGDGKVPIKAIKVYTPSLNSIED